MFQETVEKGIVVGSLPQNTSVGKGENALVQMPTAVFISKLESKNMVSSVPFDPLDIFGKDGWRRAAMADNINGEKNCFASVAEEGVQACNLAGGSAEQNGDAGGQIVAYRRKSATDFALNILRSLKSGQVRSFCYPYITNGWERIKGGAVDDPAAGEDNRCESRERPAGGAGLADEIVPVQGVHIIRAFQTNS